MTPIRPSHKQVGSETWDEQPIIETDRIRRPSSSYDSHRHGSGNTPEEGTYVQFAPENSKRVVSRSNSFIEHDVSHSYGSSIHMHQGYVASLPSSEYFIATNNIPEEEKQNLQLKDNISEKYALVHEKDVHREGGIYSSLFVRRATIMSLWFLCSFTSIVLNKYILSYLNVDAGILGECQILMTTFFGGIMMYLPICRSIKHTGKQTHMNKRHFFKTISLLGWLRCGAVICSVVGLKYVAVSFSETIKSSAPLFTAVVAYLLLGEYSGLYVNLSLMPIMFGLAISTSTELSFNMTGFLAAISNNILDCIQNVFSKKLLSGTENKFSPLELQFYTSVAATVIQMPLWFFFLDAQEKLYQLDQYTVLMLLLNSVIFYAQSLFAYLLMSLISPVTFSVSNTVKRAGLIWFSILVFGNEVTILNAFGTLVVVAGVFLYQRARMKETSQRVRMMEEKRHKGKVLPI